MGPRPTPERNWILLTTSDPGGGPGTRMSSEPLWTP